MIAKRISAVKNRIHRAAGRRKVRLVAVSKTKSAMMIDEAADAGITDFGENYLQEALGKIRALENRRLVWHFIGAIQSKKAAKISQNFDWVQSVESIKIAKKLNDNRPKNLPKLKILMQINIDDEAQKSGASISEIDDLVAAAQNLENIVPRGLMCIPNPKNAVESFKKMAAIFARYPQFDTLSMGMSADFEAAILNGASMVRVGSDIFGER